MPGISSLICEIDVKIIEISESKKKTRSVKPMSAFTVLTLSCGTHVPETGQTFYLLPSSKVLNLGNRMCLTTLEID